MSAGLFMTLSLRDTAVNMQGREPKEAARQALGGGRAAAPDA